MVPRASYLALAMTENEERTSATTSCKPPAADELEAALRSQRISTRREALPPFPLFSQTNRQWSARTNESSEFAGPRT